MTIPKETIDACVQECLRELQRDSPSLANYEMSDRAADGTRRYQTFAGWRRTKDRCRHEVGLEEPCGECRVRHEISERDRT